MSLTARIISYTTRIFEAVCFRASEIGPLPPLLHSRGNLKYRCRFPRPRPRAKYTKPYPLKYNVTICDRPAVGAADATPAGQAPWRLGRRAAGQGVGGYRFSPYVITYGRGVGKDRTLLASRTNETGETI